MIGQRLAVLDCEEASHETVRQACFSRSQENCLRAFSSDWSSEGFQDATLVFLTIFLGKGKLTRHFVLEGVADDARVSRCDPS